MSYSLSVPYALDNSGQVMAAMTAPKMGSYTCLACGLPLVLRRRYGYQPHFTHLAEALGRCSGERVTLQAARHLLRAQLLAELQHTNRFSWQLHCPGVNGLCRDGALLTRSHAPCGWTGVERDVIYGGTFRFDVAITQQDQVRFGFEVRLQRAWPRQKRRNLEVPWLAFVAEDILAFRPRTPRSGSAAAERCAACEEVARHLAKPGSDEEEQQRLAEAYHRGAVQSRQAWKRVLARVREAAGARLKAKKKPR